MLETNEYIRLANMLREVANDHFDCPGDDVFYKAGIHHAANIIGKLGGETDEVEE